MRTQPRIGNLVCGIIGIFVLIAFLSLIGCASGGASAPATYSVGGAVSGLAGSGLVLQDNGGNNLAVSANGAFTFPTALSSGNVYDVTVLTQPTSPSQTCVPTLNNGTVTSNVTNVSVACTTNTYTVGGMLSGLAGSGLVLQDNNGNNLAVSANGSFTFTTALASGTAYSVTVLNQPNNLSQACVPTLNAGTVTSSNVTNVSVVCTTDAFTVGGTVSGLAGSGLVLQDNSGNNLAVSASGSFNFTMALVSGTAYRVTVLSQPTNLSQTCVPTLNTGTVTSSNVTSVSVVCTTDTFTVGGNVSGLAGSGLVLQDNSSNNLAVSASGSFAFTTALASGTAFSVTVLAQPTNLSQTCVPTLNTGTVISSNVTNVSVACTTNTFTVGGSVLSLAGSGLVLQDNSGNNLAVAASGSFTFTTALASGTAYSVTVLTQPTNLSQTCVATLNTGTVTSSNVTNVSVACTTNSYTVGGTLSGLAGSGLVLQDNSGDNLTVSTSGSFTFTTALASGTAYKVTVFSQPTNLSQTCVPTLNAGTVTSSNVTNVSVVCTTDTFTVGGTISGLKASGLVLQDNGGNNLAVLANGSFTFTTALTSGTDFAVTVLTQPSNPTQSCGVSDGSGVVSTAAINNVTVSCVTPTTALIVTDEANNRVVIYDIPFSTGQSANVVLGQANFTTAGTGTTASTMNSPFGNAVDNAGNLYVTEDGNCRMTQFVPPFSNGMSASIVFGQPNLTTGNCAAGVSATSLGNCTLCDSIIGLAIDSVGNLWVADSGDNRVLEYMPPFSNGMAATLAIGQANLTSGNPNQGGTTPIDATLFDPVFPVFDSSGNLWINDFMNSRILEFKPPFATGMAASVVLGQADFTQGSANQGGVAGANSFSSPDGVAFDSSGNLWMADAFNNRVLEFVPPFTNNMNASLVLGQVDFTQSSANQGGASPTSATISFPHQVSFDSSGRLFVSDTGNHRMLVFTPPFSNGMNASLVIGQPNFTSDTSATTATGQNFPTGEIVPPPFY